MFPVARYGAGMNITKPQGAVFAAGLVLVVVVLFVAWRVVASSSPLKSKAQTAALVPQSPLIESNQASACPAQPFIGVASQKDGQFPFQSDLAGLTATEIGSFIVIGKESASAGRPRDAETALLMACRLADKLKGTGSVESADAKYQLGWHYAALAHQSTFESAAKARDELLARAQLLYSDSLNTYQARFGEAHEKSRFAAEGLASVRQTLAQAQTVSLLSEPRASGVARKASEPVKSAVSSQSAAASAPRSTPRKTELAKAAPPSRQAPNPTAQAARMAPSFDCRRARSVPEKMICSDAELARLDRELGRVFARARNATSDRAAFRRQQDHEWLRREATCRDRDCLLRWYEARREQLIREIEGQRPLSAKATR